LEGVDNAELVGGLGPNSEAPIVVQGWYNVPGFKGMWGPGLAIGWLFMGEDLDSWGCNWGAIEIIAPMDLFPGGELRVDAGASEEVEREFGLG
jgi:hypothetical protein